jgi:soluble lytic murein transglycosylase-like protein
MGYRWGISVCAAGALWAAQVSTVGVDQRTGRLVRVTRNAPARTVATKVIEAREVRPQAPPVYNAAPARSFDEMVEGIARRYDIRSSFVHAVIKAESNYNPRAVSHKGALGLMQLVPKTARELGVRNAFDPAQNVEGGVRYLRYLLDTYKDARLTLAAYNAGPGAVDRYGGIPPYSETRQFVNRVGRLYNRYNQTMRPAAPEPLKPASVTRIYRLTDATGFIRYTTNSQ